MVEISPLMPYHDFDEFDCEEVSVNEFLKIKSRIQQKENLTNIFVIHKNNKVLAYYAIFSCHFRYKNEHLGQKIRIPGICIGQLGVDKRFKNKKLGLNLFQHSIAVANKIQELAGCRIIYVEALNDAKDFWEKLNFKEIEIKKNNQFKMVFDINFD